MKNKDPLHTAIKAKEKMQERYTNYNRKKYCKALSDLKDLIMQEITKNNAGK